MEEVLNIYISGQIGSSYDEDGNVKVKGVDFVDVVEQVQNNPQATKFVIHLNSPGGYVEVGNAIADFLGSLSNAHIVGSGLVASIATKIFVSVPVQNRTLKEGTKFMIHNPFLAQTGGDADSLTQQAADLKAMEKELEKSYAKATGLTEAVLSEMMKAETYLTPEQCVKFGFASAVVPDVALKAVAMTYANTNQMNTTNQKPGLVERLKKAAAILTGSEESETVETAEANNRNALAVEIMTNGGTLKTNFEDVMIGDTITKDGEPVDGEFEIVEGEYAYTTPEGEVKTVGPGAVLIVEGGLIMTIKTDEVPAENGYKEEDEEEAKNLESKVEELTKALEEANANLEAEKAKNETLEAEMKAAVEEMEAKAEIKSNFTPPAQAQTFRKPEVTLSAKEKMEARRKEYGAKK